MPIISIAAQPASNSLHAAYRPVLVKVWAQRTDLEPVPPVVYCDIYVNGVYYRTHAKTFPVENNGTESLWQFDIQNALQEYLESKLSTYGGSAIEEKKTVSARFYCRLRSSGYNVNGFITTEGTAPVQGTSSTPASPGTGVQTNEAFVVNATLQSEFNQNLATHLNSYKTGTWAATTYPLTQRPNPYMISRQDNDHFPILDLNKGCYSKLVLNYRFINQSLIRQAEYSLPPELCVAAITATDISQSGSDMIISWTYTGTPGAFRYRIDGGPWIVTDNATITVSGLSVASHTVEIVPFCNCNDGTGSGSIAFDVVDEFSLCAATITNITGVQTGAGILQVTMTTTGLPVLYNYRINGGSWLTAGSNPFTITGLTPGDMTLEIVPKCENGTLGTGMSKDFVIVGTAQYTITGYNTANGNHSIARTFDDGKTAVHYRVFCALTTTWQGPFTATFTVGSLTSSAVTGTGPHCNTAMTDVTFTP